MAMIPGLAKVKVTLTSMQEGLFYTLGTQSL